MITYSRSIFRLALLGLTVLLLITTKQLLAQSLASELSPVGTWEGPLYKGQESMTLAFTISQDDEGYSAVLISSAMGIYGMPADSVSMSGPNLTIRLNRLDAEFSGTLRTNEAGSEYIRIDGDWFQYSELVTVILEPVEQASF